ncbi:MAG: class II aldolase/adducin family protein [Oscillospiraceae bacterium]|nr:class II aldolase/adducin family protein [Oscillospiraceae bacterium]
MEERINRAIIDQMIRLAARMDSLGLVDAFSGNLSVMDNGLLYVSPTGKSKATYTTDSVAVIDSCGNQIHGLFAPTSEYKMHRAVYSMRDDIGAVVHTHSPYLTSYAIRGKPVFSKAYTGLMMIFGEIPVLPYGQPGTDKIYEGLQELLQTHHAVLLKNHGALVVGKDLEQAVNRAEAAESIAKTVFLSEMFGEPTALPDTEIAKIYNQLF